MLSLQNLAATKYASIIDDDYDLTCYPTKIRELIIHTRSLTVTGSKIIPWEKKERAYRRWFLKTGDIRFDKRSRKYGNHIQTMYDINTWRYITEDDVAFVSYLVIDSQMVGDPKEETEQWLDYENILEAKRRDISIEKDKIRNSHVGGILEELWADEPPIFAAINEPNKYLDPWADRKPPIFAAINEPNKYLDIWINGPLNTDRSRAMFIQYKNRFELLEQPKRSIRKLWYEV